MNGGPGASSFGYGYLTELGPFYATNSSGVQENPKAWSTVANVLFLDSPSDVGFSVRMKSLILSSIRPIIS